MNWKAGAITGLLGTIIMTGLGFVINDSWCKHSTKTSNEWASRYKEVLTAWMADHEKLVEQLEQATKGY